LEGVGLEKDENMVIDFLGRAADQELISAQLHLAALFRQGRVIERMLFSLSVI
jgi:TPR repeat protein